MAYTLNTVLDTLKNKITSITAASTEIKDLVYLAKSVEAITGADYVLNMVSNQTKDPLILDIGDADTLIELTAEQMTNNVIRIMNSSGNPQAATTIALTIPEKVASFVLVNDVTCPIIVNDIVTVDNNKKALIIHDGESVDNGFTPIKETLQNVGELTFYGGNGLGERTLDKGDANTQLVKGFDGLPKWDTIRGRTGTKLFTGATFDIDTWNPNFHLTGMTVPDLHEDNYPLLSNIKPFGRGQSSQENYSAQLFKLSNGTVRVQGQRTESNYGSHEYYDYAQGMYLSFPADLKDKKIVTVHTAYASTWVVFEDGSCYATGNNSNGHLGVNDTSIRYNFTQLNWFTGTNPYRKIKQLLVVANKSSSYVTCAALTQGNEVYCWGYNNYGSTGTGGTGSTNSPVATSLANISKLWGSGGDGAFFFAWSELDQKLYSWGFNSHGNCARGNTSHQTSPGVVAIPGGRTPKSVMCFGYTHPTNSDGSTGTLIVMTDGTIWGAGKNGYGELALNNTSQQTNLTQVGNSGYGIRLDGSDDAHSVDEIWCVDNTRYTTIYARLKDGSTATWGYNGSYDMAARGDYSGHSQKVNIIPTMRNVKKMVFSNNNDGSEVTGMALTDDGMVWSIGYNGNAQRASGRDGTPPQNWGYNWHPILTPAGAKFQGHIIDINSYGYSSNSSFIAVTKDLEMYGWGYNGHYAVSAQYEGTNMYAPYLYNGLHY